MLPHLFRIPDCRSDLIKPSDINPEHLPVYTRRVRTTCECFVHRIAHTDASSPLRDLTPDSMLDLEAAVMNAERLKPAEAFYGSDELVLEAAVNDARRLVS